MRSSSSARHTSQHVIGINSKVERVNGVIVDVLRSFAGERAEDWPALVPLEELTINDSVSHLKPRPATRPSTLTAASTPRDRDGGSAGALVGAAGPA